MSAAPEPLAVIGGGYVGLVSTVGLAQLGYEVHCIETNPERLAMLRRGEVPFFEPGLEDALRQHAARIHFAADHDAARLECRLFFVAVGTPTSESGEADLGAVWSVIDQLDLAGHQAVVMKSTVPPGTGVACRQRLDARGMTDVVYVSAPEFLRESTGLYDFANPDRVVIGDDGTWAGDAVEELYRPLTTSDRVVRTDVTTAETLKLAANAFLTAKISFINEIANLCDAAGADVTAVARGIGLDPRIGPQFLQAGIGFGGSCFGKDLKALAHESERLGADATMVRSILAINDRQWRRVLDKLRAHLGDLTGGTVAVLGLAFKPGTSNVRDATSIPLLAGLHDAGMEVRAYDPKATREILRRDSPLGDDLLAAIELAPTPVACTTGADATVLVTEWPEVVGLDWTLVAEAMRGDLVVDGRNVLDRAAIAAAGLRYEGIGRRPIDTAVPAP